MDRRSLRKWIFRIVIIDGVTGMSYAKKCRPIQHRHNDNNDDKRLMRKNRKLENTTSIITQTHGHQLSECKHHQKSKTRQKYYHEVRQYQFLMMITQIDDSKALLVWRQQRYDDDEHNEADIKQ